MAITTMYTVKLTARLYDIIATGAPTTATVGEIGYIYVDLATGLSYECTDDSDPYVWAAYTDDDAQITHAIGKIENDYLRIRGRAFAVDDDDNIVYPDDAEDTAAEMVCYFLAIGSYFGRGKDSESLSSRSAQYEQKIMGYPISIVGPIKRYIAP